MRGHREIVLFLVEVTIEHPAIGIPVDIVVIGVVVWAWAARAKAKRQAEWSTTSTAASFQARSMPRPVLSPRKQLFRGVAQVDPDFSLVLFEDFVYALYATVHQARGSPRTQTLVPYVRADVLAGLAAGAKGIEKCDAIVVGALRYRDVQIGMDGRFHVTFEIEANYTETAHGEAIRRTTWSSGGCSRVRATRPIAQARRRAHHRLPQLRRSPRRPARQHVLVLQHGRRHRPARLDGRRRRARHPEPAAAPAHERRARDGHGPSHGRRSRRADPVGPAHAQGPGVLVAALHRPRGRHLRRDAGLVVDARMGARPAVRERSALPDALVLHRVVQAFTPPQRHGERAHHAHGDRERDLGQVLRRDHRARLRHRARLHRLGRRQARDRQPLAGAGLHRVLDAHPGQRRPHARRADRACPNCGAPLQIMPDQTDQRPVAWPARG